MGAPLPDPKYTSTRGLGESNLQYASAGEPHKQGKLISAATVTSSVSIKGSSYGNYNPC